MKGQDLVDYLRMHAETELGLVCPGHMCDLFELAGVPCNFAKGGRDQRRFVSIADHGADDLLDAAAARLALTREGWQLPGTL